MPNFSKNLRPPSIPPLSESEEEEYLDASDHTEESSANELMEDASAFLNTWKDQAVVSNFANQPLTETGVARRDGAHLILPGSMDPPVLLQGRQVGDEAHPEISAPNSASQPPAETGARRKERAQPITADIVTPPVPAVRRHQQRLRDGAHLEIPAFPEIGQVYNQAHLEAPAGGNTPRGILEAAEMLDNPTPDVSLDQAWDSFRSSAPPPPPGYAPLYNVNTSPSRFMQYGPMHNIDNVQGYQDPNPEASRQRLLFAMQQQEALQLAMNQPSAELALFLSGNQLHLPVPFSPIAPAFQGAHLQHPRSGWPRTLMVMEELHLNDLRREPFFFQSCPREEQTSEANFYSGNHDLLGMTPVVIRANFDLKKNDKIQIFLTLADPNMPPGDTPRVCSQRGHNYHLDQRDFFRVLPMPKTYSVVPRPTSGIITQVVTIMKANTPIYLQFECTSEFAIPMTEGMYWLHIRLARDVQLLMHAVIPVTIQPTLANEPYLRFSGPGWYPGGKHQPHGQTRMPTPDKLASRWQWSSPPGFVLSSRLWEMCKLS